MNCMGNAVIKYQLKQLKNLITKNYNIMKFLLGASTLVTTERFSIKYSCVTLHLNHKMSMK